MGKFRVAVGFSERGVRTSLSEPFGVVVERRNQRPQLLEIVVAPDIAEIARHALEMGDGAHWAVGENTVAVPMLVGAGDHIDMGAGRRVRSLARSEEHTSELQSLMRISYAVFCLKNKNQP